MKYPHYSPVSYASLNRFLLFGYFRGPAFALNDIDPNFLVQLPRLQMHDGMYVLLQDFHDTVENLDLSFLSCLLLDLITFLDYKNSLFDLQIKDILLYLPISTFFIIYYEMYIDLKYFVQNIKLGFSGN